jgi:uncharacterized membrane protein YedE/YeeE
MSGILPDEAAAYPRTTAARQAWLVLAALGAGTVFGLGLAWAQMIDPLKVLGFLDVAGAWDGSLALVLVGAVLTATIGYRAVLRRSQPLLDEQFHLPSIERIDAALLAGAAIFGVGWGVGGYCPGPAIASLAYANPEALWFVPAMLAGAGLQRLVHVRAAGPNAPRG